MMMRIGSTVMGLGLALGLSACGGSEGSMPAWDPPGIDGGEAEDASTSSAMDDGSDAPVGDDSGGTGGAPGCTPGETIECTCPDGSMGEHVCNDEGDGFSPCVCDDSGTTTGEPGGSSDDGGGPMEDVVCYPGSANDYSTCLPLHTFEPMPEGYEYPPAYMGDDNYRPPIALIDLEEVDPGTWLAPNFQLDEIAQLYKGRYAVVQPHAIASLQALRDEVGAISVNSGYRSPAYNAGLSGSATYSRHMYGDAYDLDPLEVGLSTLESACTAQGGMLVEYTTHVHCDFRFDPVDEQFFGPPMAADEAPAPVFEASLVQDADGSWTAPAEGFDEGAPQRRWVALDAEGEVLVRAMGERFVPPPGTSTLEVRVGAQVQRTVALGSR